MYSLIATLLWIVAGIGSVTGNLVRTDFLLIGILASLHTIAFVLTQIRDKEK